jgi:hypothetical protein
MKTARNHVSRRGATATEFAVVAPILFLTIFACFEFGRLCMMRNLAQDAAYEAARFAMVEGSDTEDAVARAQAILARLGTRNAQIIVNDGEKLTDDARAVKVEVRIPIRDNALVMSRFTRANNIEATIELLKESYDGYFDGATR